eukprot:353706-Chlamydomonas_euryale.AAC.3
MERPEWCGCWRAATCSDMGAPCPHRTGGCMLPPHSSANVHAGCCPPLTGRVCGPALLLRTALQRRSRGDAPPCLESRGFGWQGRAFPVCMGFQLEPLRQYDPQSRSSNSDPLSAGTRLLLATFPD